MDTVYTALVFPVLMLVAQALVALGQRKVNQRMDEGERKRDEARAETEAKRRAEAQWRSDIEARMESQDNLISTILTAQCSQIRSDIIHKCHRYLDDIGMASVEEKEALKAEHNEYSAVCKANSIENNFVDQMVQRVMDLPERS